MRKIILFLLFLQKSFNIEFNEEDLNIISKFSKKNYNKKNINELLISNENRKDLADSIYFTQIMILNKFESKYGKENCFPYSNILKEIEKHYFFIKYFKKKEFNKMQQYLSLLNKLKLYSLENNKIE
jgi:hypothetical protein